MPGAGAQTKDIQSRVLLAYFESTFMVLCFQRKNRAVLSCKHVTVVFCSRFLVFEVLKIKIQIVLL
jgi:hypothetical protein